MNKAIKENKLRRIRTNIIIIMTGLAVSGVTAFPIEAELRSLTTYDSLLPIPLQSWLNTVYQAVKATNTQYPWLSYGTDWLAFAHLVLAVLFIGPLRDPVKNIWVVQFGLICCILIIPLAFIAGPIRGIPVFWQLVDCSFGVIGFVPLLVSYNIIRKIEKEQS
jgi:hypothetical protein